MAKNPILDLRVKLEKRLKDSTEVFPDFTTVKQIDVVPSGCAIVDAVTGLGGFPRGRLTELYGGYSTGKTTLATQASAAAQRQRTANASEGGVVLYVDFEHAFDAAYGHALGLDLSPEKFIFCQPDYFEQGDFIIDSFVNEGLVDFIVVDSAAAMTPKDELEGNPIEGGGAVGLQARLMSKMLARLTKKISRGRKPALVMINQTRARFDFKNAKNNGEQSAANSAIKFYSSVRMALEIIVSEGDEQRSAKSATDQLYTNNRVRITTIKNKLAPPWMRGQFTISYGQGVNNLVSVAELAEQKLGIMSGAGFFKYTGDTAETSFTCRGREAFVDLLRDKPELLKEMERKVLTVMKEEQVKSLGVTHITVGDAAKEIEAEAGVLVLEDSPRVGDAPSIGGLPVEDV